MGFKLYSHTKVQAALIPPIEIIMPENWPGSSGRDHGNRPRRQSVGSNVVHDGILKFLAGSGVINCSRLRIPWASSGT